MKRLVFSTFLLLNTLFMSAQVFISPEIGLTAVKRDGFGLGWKPGTKIGAGIQFQISESLFSIQSGIYYSLKGYSFFEGPYENNTGSVWFEDASLTRHFLQLPVMARFSWKINESSSIFTGVGPYIGISLQDKWKHNPAIVTVGGTYPSEGVNVSGYPNSDLYTNPRSFDWGCSAMVGIEANHWIMKIHYDLSLGKESSQDPIATNYHSLTLAVGYKFQLTK